MLALCLVEALWLDSMSPREEKRAVAVHDVARAPVQREFDAAIVVGLFYDPAAVPRDVFVFVFVLVLVLGERPTSVQDHFYL